MRNALSAAYRFKPGRTFAQSLGAALVADGANVVVLDWVEMLSVSGIAGLVSFLMIWAEGGDMLADDKRVTGTKEYVGEHRAE